MSEHVRDRLSAYLDRELPPTDDDAVVIHLRGCEACRSHLAALTAVDKVARALPVEAPAGYFDTLPGRVRARLEATSAERATEDRERSRFAGRARVVGPARSLGPTVRRPLGLPVWTWAVAAALLLAVVTPLTVRNQRAPSTTAPETQASPAAPPMTMRGGDEAPALAPAREAVRSDADRQKARAEGLRPELKPAAPAFDLAQSQPPPPAAGYAGEPRSAEMESGAAVQSPASRPAVASAPAAERRQRAPGPGGPYAQAQTQGQLQAPAAEAAGRVAPGSTAEELSAADARDGARGDKEEESSSLAKSAREQDEVAPRGMGAAANLAAPADEREYSRLAGPVAQTVGALRARREAWRSFPLAYPKSPRADEARVRTIETGIAAWRLGHDPVDLRQARIDAASYLSRPDAVQADRVRAVLEKVGGR